MISTGFYLRSFRWVNIYLISSVFWVFLYGLVLQSVSLPLACVVFIEQLLESSLKVLENASIGLLDDFSSCVIIISAKLSRASNGEAKTTSFEQFHRIVNSLVPLVFRARQARQLYRCLTQYINPSMYEKRSLPNGAPSAMPQHSCDLRGVRQRRHLCRPAPRRRQAAWWALLGRW